ncbi:MAG: hypothetical protein QOH26_547 [Actinomycetota bacterium]|nr:hypothetical protein [Actinomycetota bacterium]
MSRDVPGSEGPSTPGEVVPLGKEPPPQPPRRGSRPRGLHGLAIASTFAFSLIAALSFVAFITVRWPGDYGRVVVAVFMFAVVGAIASTSAAVLTAARATYAINPGASAMTDDEPPPEGDAGEPEQD